MLVIEVCLVPALTLVLTELVLSVEVDEKGVFLSSVPVMDVSPPSSSATCRYGELLSVSATLGLAEGVLSAVEPLSSTMRVRPAANTK